MPTSDPKPANEALTETLSELESLIAGSAETSVPVLKETTDGGHGQQNGIPILDELVYADDVGIDEWEQHLKLPSSTTDQMLHMIDRIEHRLTDELETLVQTLKTTMKASILDELKARLESTSQDPPSSAPGHTSLKSDQ